MTRTLRTPAITDRRKAVKVSIPDPLLNNGSLALWDPTPGVGVSDFHENKAWSSLKAILGSGTQESLRLKGLLSTGMETAAAMGTTVKGAPFFGWKRSTGAATGNVNWSMYSNELQAYVAANYGHSFFLGLHLRLFSADFSTSTTSTTRYAGFINSASDRGSIRRNSATGRLTGMPVASLLGVREAPIMQGLHILDGAWAGLGGTLGASNAIMLAHNGGAGSPVPSSAFYGMYLEDLTVSGRTYAQADALWNARCLARAAGVLAGDTGWVQPA